MRFRFNWRPSRAREEALVWLARLKRGLRQSEGTALLTWLKRRSHRRAIAKAAVEWHGPEVLAVLSEIFPIPPAILEPRRRVHPVFLVAAALIGTCVTLTAPIAVLLALDLHRHFYTTSPGATRQLTLEDGTRVELNRGTAIRVVYADQVRNVELVRGEAVISVAAPSRYPFYIHAMGRAFETRSAIVDVRLAAPNRLSVTVIKGAVTELGGPPRSGAKDQPNRLEPLQMLVIEHEEVQDEESGDDLTPQALRSRLAWRGGT